MFSKKKQKLIASIIAGVLILSMILPLLVSAIQ